MRALKDEDDKVRRAAAKALGEIWDAKAIEALIVALKEEEGSVRCNAADVLGFKGYTRAV